MFDIGFWEIIVIAVVALVVVGPERFPGMIRKIGYWVGQFRRMASAVKSEFEQEVDKAERLKELLEEQKQIVERNANVDLTQPAVKPKTEQAPALDEQSNESSQSSSEAASKSQPKS